MRFCDSKSASSCDLCFPRPRRRRSPRWRPQLGRGSTPFRVGLPIFPDHGLTATILPFVERFSTRPLEALGVRVGDAFPHPSAMARYGRAVRMYHPAAIVDSVYTRYQRGESAEGRERSGGGIHDARGGGRSRGPWCERGARADLPLLLPANRRQRSTPRRPRRRVGDDGVAGDGRHLGADCGDRRCERADGDQRRSRDVGGRRTNTSTFCSKMTHSSRRCRRHHRANRAYPCFTFETGARAAFLEEFRERFSEVFALITPDEVDELALFGPEPMRRLARSRIGDFMGIAPGAGRTGLSRQARRKRHHHAWIPRGTDARRDAHPPHSRGRPLVRGIGVEEPSARGLVDEAKPEGVMPFDTRK